jgi:hypothetical protein
MVTTSNCRSIPNPHTLQFTTEHNMSAQYFVSSPVVVWRRIPTMSSAAMLTFYPLATVSQRTHSESESESEFLCSWRFTANHFILAPNPLSLNTTFFQPNPCGHSSYVTSSLTRGWIRLLWICLAFSSVRIAHLPRFWTAGRSVGRSVKLLLAFTSTVIPGFILLEIHDQHFYSLLDIDVFRNGASSSTKDVSVFVCRLTTIFYSLRFETSPTWRTRSPYLYLPGTRWPSYTLSHWIPFSSPPTTRKATVELFVTASR